MISLLSVPHSSLFAPHVNLFCIEYTGKDAIKEAKDDLSISELRFHAYAIFDMSISVLSVHTRCVSITKSDLCTHNTDLDMHTMTTLQYHPRFKIC
jgi:hypothetical protein